MSVGKVVTNRRKSSHKLNFRQKKEIYDKFITS